MFTRVSIEKVFCCNRPKTYRLPANAAATVGSATVDTYCCAVLSISSDGASVSNRREDGFSVTDGKYEILPPSVLSTGRMYWTWALPTILALESVPTFADSML